jgi:hypothetical protein
MVEQLQWVTMLRMLRVSLIPDLVASGSALLIRVRSQSKHGNRRSWRPGTIITVSLQLQQQQRQEELQARVRMERRGHQLREKSWSD